MGVPVKSLDMKPSRQAASEAAAMWLGRVRIRSGKSKNGKSWVGNAEPVGWRVADDLSGVMSRQKTDQLSASNDADAMLAGGGRAAPRWRASIAARCVAARSFAVADKPFCCQGCRTVLRFSRPAAPRSSIN